MLLIHIIILIILILPIWLFLIYKGYKLCKKNNAIGVLLLFISLNIFGLILGIALLYNLYSYNKLQKEELLDKIDKFLDVEFKNKKEKSKIKQNLLKDLPIEKNKQEKDKTP